jgi:hypothetical protein
VPPPLALWRCPAVRRESGRLLPQPGGLDALSCSERHRSPRDDRNVCECEQDVGYFGISAVCVFDEVPDSHRDLEHGTRERDPIARPTDSLPKCHQGHDEDRQDANPDTGVRPKLLARTLKLVVRQVPLQIDQQTDDDHADGDPESGEGLIAHEPAQMVELITMRAALRPWHRR